MKRLLRPRAAAAAALGGAVFFWGAVCATQALRPDLDPLSAPLSNYLAGPFGTLLHVAYYIMAGAILLFAYAFRAELASSGRTASITALLAITALGVAGTAAAHPGQTVAQGGAATLREGLHLLAAGISLLAASIALTLAALRLRGTAPAGFARGALALALVENLTLAGYVFIRTPWRGAQQKLVIALITAALMAGAAQCLRRRGLVADIPDD